MTDRELLELAAKAAGMKLTWGDKYQVGGDLVDCSDIPYVLTGEPDQAPWYWNPIEDDGDALRLAVKLRLIIDPVVKPLDGTYPCAAVLIPGGINYITESFGDDPCAATRRAIVRAAAEIGKAMP